ncbi:MAG: amylo-alpha-1,6-glucosidase [Desulfobacterales bacterium]
MTVCDWLRQEPVPGNRLLTYRGDTLTFLLTLDRPRQGSAWVRTNIGSGRLVRGEIIRAVDLEEAPLGRGWYDRPMVASDSLHFRVTLPLCETGHFEAKCFFLEQGASQPAWPSGANVAVNVEPADTCCANIIYNAFVRQFGPNKSGAVKPPVDSAAITALDRAGFAVIPPSGTFRDLIRELDFIIGDLGCRILQLLPIHPTPTTYGRMGRFGSPYAALSFTDVDPALAEFDPAATPLEQFVELVDAVHARSAKIIIDIAINHTGWAAGLHESNPEWLSRDTSGQIEVPGAWGVRWEDLTKLDYSYLGLWQYMADVLLKWCRRGVDGFRCDAGYMIPVDAWHYIIARVRQQYPETVFLLEGLGGKIVVTRELLNRANFNWAYSELFQNYDRGQIEAYLPSAFEISRQDGVMVHFAETHDNLRLAARSPDYARMRTALCALAAPQGGFGFANGVEWFATEKIDVHNAPSLNWGAEINQVAEIRRLNTLLRNHPAFTAGCDLRLVQQGDGNHVVLLRDHPASGKKLIVAVNLDDRQPTTAAWSIAATGLAGTDFIDLLTGRPVAAAVEGDRVFLRLDPCQVLCLAPDDHDVDPVQHATADCLCPPRHALRQRYRAKVLEVFTFYNDTGDIGGFDLERAAAELSRDPKGFCRRLNPGGEEPRVITWQWPQDQRRQVMLPPGHFLLVRLDGRFRACIGDAKGNLGCEDGLPADDGSFFALFAPLPARSQPWTPTLKISVFAAGGSQHIDAPLLALPHPRDVKIKHTFGRQQLLHHDFLFLATNGRGGMLRAGVTWGQLKSRYDALLAANLNPEVPEDRCMVFSRCRAWVVYQGYSQAIGNDCLSAFRFNGDRTGKWQFQVPTGQGESIGLSVLAEMLPDKNAMRLVWHRQRAGPARRWLDDRHPVQLILRPDIECRGFHETVKAYLGPEQRWPSAIKPLEDGFLFTPSSGVCLNITVPGGRFTSEPEWNYMVHRPLEAERGLDPDSDLYSPGYFSLTLEGGQTRVLTAGINADALDTTPSAAVIPAGALPKSPGAAGGLTLVDTLKNSLDQYVVRRGDLKSVIAGYPWFLDWGRDSLIVVRGLVAADRWDTARAVLKQFGRFERHGTIPNMIHGRDAGNRDTSDAPLWFFTACADLVAAEGTEDFLDGTWGDRSIRAILISMAESLIHGTPNGIRMDPDSGLIFSPAHFTWMDTNHPAATPREGYPVEIQALWHRALDFLARIDAAGRRRWRHLKRQVASSLVTCYFNKHRGYFSDCLHASSDTAAQAAEPDDALRPNQLLVLTLGALDDPDIARSVLAACETLLVPGGIRSLADREVGRPLAVCHNGRIINDPHRPYQGHYVGDEDSRRKPAYHNGTAWTWLFPSFCEAWADAYGADGRRSALAWLGSGIELINQGCIGHVPEILDGDFPHAPRGCDAQAWGVSELLRVWSTLAARENSTL